MKLLFISLFLISCSVAKKAHEYANSHPEDFAAYCAKEFPVRDTAIFVEGVKLDTLYLETEPRTETTFLRDTVFKTVIFPGTTQFITKTVTRDSLVIRRDIAAETALKVENSSLKVENSSLIAVNKDLLSQRDGFKGRADWWMWACLITWGVLIIYIIVKIFGSKIKL